MNVLTDAQTSLSKALGGESVGGARINWQPCVYVRKHDLGCMAGLDAACLPEEISEQRGRVIVLVVVEVVELLEWTAAQTASATTVFVELWEVVLTIWEGNSNVRACGRM